jgi:hypothetical protein
MVGIALQKHKHVEALVRQGSPFGSENVISERKESLNHTEHGGDEFDEQPDQRWLSFKKIQLFTDFYYSSSRTFKGWCY